MMGMKINGMACALVALLAGLTIGGTASAAPTDSGDGEGELVLVGKDVAGVDDGLVYILSLGFAGDFFGDKDKKYARRSAPALPSEPTDEVVELIDTTGGDFPSDDNGHGNDNGGGTTSAAPEPSAALLMAMGLTVSSMHLRRRSRR